MQPTVHSGQPLYPNMSRTMYIKNESAEIVKAVKWIANMSTALGLSMKECFALELSLEEILTNVVGYAFDEATEFSIKIAFTMHNDKVTLQVEDPGKPFNPLNLPAPPPVTNIADVRIGGLGIHIVKKLMHEIDYSRINGKNVLTTSLNLSPQRIREVDDGLTGLYLRQHFDIRLMEEVARVRRHGGELGLLITDIDLFNEINEQHGPQVGDQVLREMANILKSSIRRDVDIPCRYSGEEFATILPCTNAKGSKTLAERFRRTCEDHEFGGAAEPIHLTISCGTAAVVGDDAVDSDELVNRSFSALVEAKTSGRNKVVTYQSVV